MDRTRARRVGDNGAVEFAELVRSRRMTRSFDADRPVERTQLKTLLKLAIRAPSAGHTQGWHFLVVDDITSRDAFWNATATGPPDTWRTGMSSAPALVVCLSDAQAYLDRYAQHDKGWTDRDPLRWPIPYWHVDVGMAAMIILLAAQDFGLGACFFGVPGDRWAALRAAFDLDSRLAPVGVIALGYPATANSGPLRRGRRHFDEVVRFAGDAVPGLEQDSP